MSSEGKLIIYFSRAGSNGLFGTRVTTGNTEFVANFIHEITNAELFKIRPAVPYPDSYMSAVFTAKREENPALAEDTVYPDLSKYDTIFFGYPIWWWHLPEICKSFIRHYQPDDWKGKKIIPFCTHGSSGFADSLDDLKSVLPECEIMEGFESTASTCKECKPRVEEWIQKLKCL